MATKKLGGPRGVTMTSCADCIPDKIKVSFFEYQRREWEKVVETSEKSRIAEKQPECLLHWESVSKYAQQQITEIDKELQQLKLNDRIERQQ